MVEVIVMMNERRWWRERKKERHTDGETNGKGERERNE